MSTYPKADTRTQWFADNYRGSTIDPNCGCLHTTETTDWPSYSGGATAPNLTGKPDCRGKRILWRQHYPDEMSARALQNDAGGVETNTANVVQVELIGTCDPGTRDRWRREGRKQDEDFIFWPEAPEWALREVAALVADYHKRHGIKIDGPAKWLPYPSSYGQSNPNRMTFTEWHKFYGWCGHQHVPENDHGDPGALPWSRIAAFAVELVKPSKPPKPESVEPDFYVAHLSGKWDAPDDAWKQAIANAVHARAEVIMFTETTVDGRMRRVCPGRWGFGRLDEQPGDDECSIMWKRSARKRASKPYATRLADTQFYTAKGHLRPPVTSITEALEDNAGNVDLFTALHMPSGDTAPRLKAHVEVTDAIPEAWDKGMKLNPGAGRILGVDTNRDFRREEVRKAWADTFPMLAMCWNEVGLPDHGTHGNAVLDGIAAGKGRLTIVSARVLPKVAGFDHRGVLVGLVRS
jgi:hypothetical protein